MLLQRHHVSATLFQHGAFGEVDLVHTVTRELLQHRGVGAGQKARADAIGDRTETQIEAARLNLNRLHLAHGRDLTGAHGSC